jgi:ureidoacrylate peracid hydrolase
MLGSSDRTALIVVDMQNAFCHPDGSFTRLGADMSMCTAAIEPCRHLVAAAHEADIPVVHVKFELRPDYSDGGVIFNEIMGNIRDEGCLIADSWDADFVEELDPGADDYILKKTRFSAFCGTQLELLLRGLGLENLVICGVTTNVCVESTVRDAAQLNYRVVVPRDAVGEVSADMHQAGLRVMEYGFAAISDTETVMTAWHGVSPPSEARKADAPGSPNFLRSKTKAVR